MAMGVFLAVAQPSHDMDFPLFPKEKKGKSKFDLQSFQHDFEDFVTKRADLTRKEAKAFFPLFHEMKRQQREIYGKIHRAMQCANRKDKVSEKDCRRILEEVRRLRKQSFEIEQMYYERFRKVLSDRVLLRVMEAEHKFSRERFKKRPRLSH